MLIIKIPFYSIIPLIPAGGVRIIEGPEDTSVIEGSAAEFPCFFVGTSNIPLWKINNTVYSIDELPSEHFYRNQTLLVTNVNLSLNLTKYQCQIANIKSSVAVLIVFPGPGMKVYSFLFIIIITLFQEQQKISLLIF